MVVPLRWYCNESI